MTHRIRFIDADRLGVIGLFLMLVVARLATPAYSEHTTVTGYVSGFVARRGIDSIGAIGWLFDRLPARTSVAIRNRGSATARSVQAASV